MKKLLFLLSLFFLSACSFIGTAYNVGSKVGAVVMDERELKDDWNDTKINMTIRNNFLKDKINYVLDVEITVFEGEVLLNGAIPTIEDMERIVEIAWQTPTVTKVYNYIRLEQPSSLDVTTQDALIASSIRTQLMMSSGITSVNYKITVDKGILYMMGIAKSEEELKKVMDIIQATEGIEKVISHVRKSYEN
ncbi:MAG: BON domain-containing protein [Alphaproteobacteria bacterium]|nr:BON domain-containing protein [Alphaproteobacteria bacterium]